MALRQREFRTICYIARRFYSFFRWPAELCWSPTRTNDDAIRVGLTYIWNFNMEFDTPTYDRSSWERDIEDRFTLFKGSLRVRITQTSWGRGL